MKKAFFITGTDTNVGKTYVASKLIEHYVAQGYKVVGMKPIAAGCEMLDGVWQNADVASLMAASNVKAPRKWVNPYCFDPPIAPHIAADQIGATVELKLIQQAFTKLAEMADIVIVEGAGGFLVPINAQETIADIPLALNIPVVLVVGMRLGCINHTLLTLEAIRARHLVFEGWIANQIDPEMQYFEKNLQEIAKLTGKNYNFIYQHLK